MALLFSLFNGVLKKLTCRIRSTLLTLTKSSRLMKIIQLLQLYT